MKRIACIFNPHSGKKRKSLSKNDFSRYTENHSVQLDWIEKKPNDHLETLAKHCVQTHCDAIVAAGGDGTINAIARAIKGTKTALIVVPLGSGNGFARHHGIPLNISKALSVLEHYKEVSIDCGTINSELFVNVAGMGFDAKISQAFKNQKTRGLTGYAQTLLKEWNLRTEEYQISSENEMWQGRAWMVSMCNGSEWGNNFKLFPQASTSDEILHAVIFLPTAISQLPALAYHLLNGKLPQYKGVKILSGKAFKITPHAPIPLHVDGEPCGITKNTLEVQVLKEKITLWIPT